MIRRPLPTLVPLIAAVLLAGCTTTGETVRTPVPEKRPHKLHEAGLERVMGKTAAQLTALFGTPDLDGHEGQAQRIQFAGPVCVLDAYLYPEKTGAVPVVTYIDARLPSGADIDRASCIAALSRRSVSPGG